MSESIPQRKIHCRFRKGWFIRDAMAGDDLSDNPKRRSDGSLPPKIITREREDGTRVDEAHFKCLTGYVQDLYITSREYKNKLNYYINIELLSKEDGEIRILRMSVFSDAGQGLLNRIENIDLQHPIAIHAGYSKSKESGFVWVKQLSMNVPQRYTKADPEDKPGWKKIETETGTIWDKSDQLRWWNGKLVHIRLDIQTNRVTPAV